MLLGIDVGTGKVAAVVIAPGARNPQAIASVDHQADLASPPNRSYQDPAALLHAARSAIRQLPGDLRSDIEAVGVTGQMHSIAPADHDGAALGPVITWQDEGCDREFLDELQRRSGHRLASGMGLASLIRQRRDGQWPDGARPISAPDLLTAALGGDPGRIEATMAHAWGLFDLPGGDWDRDALRAVDIDVGLLPAVASGRAGRVSPQAAKRFSLPEGIEIYGAIGDNQASVLASLDEPDKQIALTLGTGGQLSVVLADLPPERDTWGPSVELRPFPDRRFLAVAACLSGGAAWQWLARSAAAWASELGLEAPEIDRIYRRLNELGLEASWSATVDCRFAGERHRPDDRGAIRNLSQAPLSLGALAAGVAEGIFRNLRDMLPASLLQGRREIVASGNAMRKNPLLQQAARAVFQMPVRLSPSRESAAVGAAISASRSPR
jgi:sedoheptulokinase